LIDMRGLRFSPSLRPGQDVTGRFALHAGGILCQLQRHQPIGRAAAARVRRPGQAHRRAASSAPSCLIFKPTAPSMSSASGRAAAWLPTS